MMRISDIKKYFLQNKSYLLIFAMLVLFLSPISQVHAAFANGYSYCKVVTTSVSMVGGTSDLTNYPLTVLLTDLNLRTTGNGGHVNNASGFDIGFGPDCSGAGTMLKWEMESYTASSGAIIAHVLRPTLSHTTNDTIGMYYGGAMNTFQSTVSAVWDTNFKGVYHLANTASIVDSSGNNTNGTMNGVTNTAGQVDGASNYDGGGHHTTLGSNVALQSLTFTYSAWVYIDSPLAGANTIIGCDDGSTTCPSLVINSTGVLSLAQMANHNVGVSAGAAIPATTWTHVAATYNNSNRQYALYINGVPSGSGIGAVNSFAFLGKTTLGWGNATGLGLAGRLDELRFSNTIRTPDWIKTEYNNQSAPGTYITEGSELSSPAGGAKIVHRVTQY